MSIRYALWPILLAVAASGVAAEESCGVRAVSLLSAGKTGELAALFANQAQVAEPLQRMAERLGKVSRVEEVSMARFAEHQRVSIQSKDLPSSYQYQGHWINARSETLGAVQFHITRVPESACSLLALHMDTAQ